MLAKAHDDGLLDKQLTILARPKLLIIDELGYRAPLEDRGGAAVRADLRSSFIMMLPLLVTSNRRHG